MSILTARNTNCYQCNNTAHPSLCTNVGRYLHVSKTHIMILEHFIFHKAKPIAKRNVKLILNKNQHNICFAVLIEMGYILVYILDFAIPWYLVKRYVVVVLKQERHLPRRQYNNDKIQDTNDNKSSRIVQLYLHYTPAFRNKCIIVRHCTSFRYGCPTYSSNTLTETCTKPGIHGYQDMLLSVPDDELIIAKPVLSLQNQTALSELNSSSVVLSMTTGNSIRH